MTTSTWLRSPVVPGSAGGDGAPLPESAWRVTVLVLHVAFAGAVAGAAASVLLGDDAEGARPLLLTALGALALAYLVFGGPALVRREPRRALPYLVVLVAAVGVLGWELPRLLFLMFVLSPQIWFLVRSVGAGIAWTLAAGAAALAGPLVHWVEGAEPLEGPAQTSVGIVLSLAMGTWISRVLEQSRQRAQLIRELEDTRAELAAAHREQGIAAERQRLAREVHDTLAQGYTSIVVLAQTAAAQLPRDPGAAAERLGLIEEVARENLAEARAMVAAFSPVALDSATLVEALERLAERFGRETGVAVRVDTAALAGGPALRRDEEVVLLRGAQEALSNVRRHAGASAVVVRLSRSDGEVAVAVEDDGAGFDPGAARGSGLDGLRGRVEQVGGRVDVESAPGAGTRVTVRVPGQ
ncbi:sensor histidine kinase [Blastococcus sp. SYSU D00820]